MHTQRSNDLLKEEIQNQWLQDPCRSLALRWNRTLWVVHSYSLSVQPIDPVQWFSVVTGCTWVTWINDVREPISLHRTRLFPNWMSHPASSHTQALDASLTTNPSFEHLYLTPSLPLHFSQIPPDALSCPTGPLIPGSHHLMVMFV